MPSDVTDTETEAISGGFESFRGLTTETVGFVHETFPAG
jgi:hypothetical protein